MEAAYHGDSGNKRLRRNSGCSDAVAGTQLHVNKQVLVEGEASGMSGDEKQTAGVVYTAGPQCTGVVGRLSPVPGQVIVAPGDTAIAQHSRFQRIADPPA